MIITLRIKELGNNQISDWSKRTTTNIMINLTYILMSPLKKNMLTELKMISLISKLLHFLLKTMKRRLCEANIDFLMHNYYVCIFVEDIGYHVVSGLPSWIETFEKEKKNKIVGIRLWNNVNLFNSVSLTKCIHKCYEKYMCYLEIKLKVLIILFSISQCNARYY